MAFRQILDSDVDLLTAMAIQGVTAFITLYEDERAEEAVAAGPMPRVASRAPRGTRAPAKVAAPKASARRAVAKSPPRARPRL